MSSPLQISSPLVKLITIKAKLVALGKTTRKESNRLCLSIMCINRVRATIIITHPKSLGSVCVYFYHQCCCHCVFIALDHWLKKHCISQNVVFFVKRTPLQVHLMTGSWRYFNMYKMSNSHHAAVRNSRTGEFTSILKYTKFVSILKKFSFR